MSNWSERLVNREIVEERAGKSFNEEEWSAITEELAGRVDNFIEEVLDEIIEEKRGN